MHKISLITVSFNAGSHIAETISSVKSQSYDNLEYIVVDGGSTDETIDIIKKNNNFITRWISEPDRGIYHAMNKGIAMSSGDIIGFLNADDILVSPDALSNVAQQFQNKEIDAIHGDLVFFDEDPSKPVRKWEFIENGSFFKGWHPAHPTFYVRRSCYEKYGGYDETLKLSSDFELMLRFIEVQKISIKYLPKEIVKMRIGGATTGSIKNMVRGLKETRKAFLINNLHYPLLYPLYRYLPKVRSYLFR